MKKLLRFTFRAHPFRVLTQAVTLAGDPRRVRQDHHDEQRGSVRDIIAYLDGFGVYVAENSSNRLALAQRPPARPHRPRPHAPRHLGEAISRDTVHFDVPSHDAHRQGSKEAHRQPRRGTTAPGGPVQPRRLVAVPRPAAAHRGVDPPLVEVSLNGTGRRSTPSSARTTRRASNDFAQRPAWSRSPLSGPRLLALRSSAACRVTTTRATSPSTCT